MSVAWTLDHHLTLWSGTKDEAGAANIVDHGNFAGSVDLADAAAPYDINQVRRRNEFVVPDFLEKHGARQQLIATLHHIRAGETHAAKINRTVAAFGGALDQIQFQRPCPQRRLGDPPPAQQRSTLATAPPARTAW